MKKLLRYTGKILLFLLLLCGLCILTLLASAKEPIEKGLHKIKNVRSCIFFIFLHRI